MSTKYERLGGSSSPSDAGGIANTNSSGILNTTVNSTEESGGRVHYKVYKRRWFVLAVLCVLNVSNAITWITFAPVAGLTAVYYGVTLKQVNWLSLVFCLGIPSGFVATWLLDTLGLRVALLVGGWLNAIGLVIRYLSSVREIVPSDYSFYVVLIGQGICAIAQPNVLYAPTKLAAKWFPDSQRAIANTIGSTSNSFGMLITFAVCPAIVKTQGDIPKLLLYSTIPGAVGALLVTFGVWSASPPTPPSASAGDRHESFFQGIKKIIRNRPYMLLVATFGAGSAVFTTVLTIVEEILCARGYIDSFTSLCGALMIGCGFVGALSSGLYVDRSKRFVEVAKIAGAFATLSFITFSVFSHMRDMEPYIIASLALFGFFGFAQYPVSLELGVECVYPVAEGTSAGFMAMSGQLQGNILLLVNNALSKPLSPAEMQYQQCTGTANANATDMYTPYSAVFHDTHNTQPTDNTVTVLLYGGYLCLSWIVFTVFFRTEYKRLNAEKCPVEDHDVLNYSSRNNDNEIRNICS